MIEAKKGTDVYLFINHLKPALLVGINNKLTEELKEQYKHIVVDDLRIIFYHNEESFDLWIKESAKKKDYASSIGLVLGYPPNAVELYGKDKELGKNNIIEPMRINYHGQLFVSSLKTYKEDIKYLVENMPIPLEHQTCIELQTKSDPNGSFDKVTKINIK